MKQTNGIVRRDWSTSIIFLFLVLFVFWLLINFGVLSSDANRQLWAVFYQSIAFVGGILGLFYARLWGGRKSYIGKGILLLSIGLLLQCVGQSIYSYYIYYQQIAVPYPSLGDIGFFGSTLMYIGAAWQFAKASGVNLKSKYFKSKISVFVLPVLMLILSYMVFLRGYVFDWSNPVKIFLDFGYPFAEAIYVSIALVTLFFCWQLLGGVMKRPIIFLLLAFVFQYLSDFVFLYQSNQNTWQVGTINDLMYSISYLLMSLGIIYIGKTYLKINDNDQS